MYICMYLVKARWGCVGIQGKLLGALSWILVILRRNIKVWNSSKVAAWTYEIGKVWRNLKCPLTFVWSDHYLLDTYGFVFPCIFVCIWLKKFEMFTHICLKRSPTSSAFSSQGKKCHQLTAHGSMQRTSVQRNRNTTYKIQNTKQKIQHTNTIVIIFALECAVVTSVIVDRKEWSLIRKGSRGKPMPRIVMAVDWWHQCEFPSGRDGLRRAIELFEFCSDGSNSLNFDWTLWIPSVDPTLWIPSRWIPWTLSIKYRWIYGSFRQLQSTSIALW